MAGWPSAGIKLLLELKLFIDWYKSFITHEPPPSLPPKPKSQNFLDPGLAQS